MTISNSNDDKVKMYDHSHHFRNIPLTLTNTNAQMRIVAKANNASSNILLCLTNSHFKRQVLTLYFVLFREAF